MLALTLRQLEMFCTTVRLGSFTQAAEQLEVGQPAVSQQVAALERLLGVDLVVRVGRGVRLTEAGQLVADYGARILRLSEQLREGVSGLTGLATGRLVVGAGQTPGDYLLPAMLGAFRQQYPGIAVELEIADTRRVVQWLLRHTYDLGFIGERVEHEELELEPFLEDRVVLFAVPQHSLVQQREVALEEVLACGLIVREPGSATRATGERAFRAADITPRFAMELGSNEAVKRAVLAGLGVGLLSTYALEVERSARVLAELVVPGFDGRRMLYSARNREAPLTAAQAAFLTLARQLAAAMALPLLRSDRGG
jgi:DNA-binding transcriptional LysR family regulator